MKKLVLLLLTAWLMTLAVHAQSYSIGWDVIAGGGGLVTGAGILSTARSASMSPADRLRGALTRWPAAFGQFTLRQLRAHQC
jgi:hypothetical protein